MSSAGKPFFASISLTFAAAAMALSAPALAIDAAPATLPTILPDQPAVASTAPISVEGNPAAQLILLIAKTVTDWNASAEPAADDADDQTAAADAAVDAELECMAKVVVHEAGNQPRRGQLAVAQLIVARTASGRFPATACAVANQPGQFFRTADYHPARDSAAWASAVAVSREARDGTTEAVAPGALFFHAAYAAEGSFFRNRQRVAQLGDHVFYR